MKKIMRRGLVAAVVLFVIGAVFVVVSAQREVSEVREDVKRRAEYIRSQINPDTSSENWRQLSDDIGLMLYVDQFGNRCGTLYIKVGDLWNPIAIDGISELMGPRALPAEL